MICDSSSALSQSWARHAGAPWGSENGLHVTYALADHSEVALERLEAARAAERRRAGT